MPPARPVAPRRHVTTRHTSALTREAVATDGAIRPQSSGPTADTSLIIEEGVDVASA